MSVWGWVEENIIVISGIENIYMDIKITKNSVGVCDNVLRAKAIEKCLGPQGLWMWLYKGKMEKPDVVRFKCGCF